MNYSSLSYFSIHSSSWTDRWCLLSLKQQSKKWRPSKKWRLKRYHIIISSYYCN